MKRASCLIALLFAAVAFVSCHQARPVALDEECHAKPFGEASVEFGAANAREPRSNTTPNERLVVQVRMGTIERSAIADAVVVLRVAGNGADSGHVVAGWNASDGGTVVIDSLTARRYEVDVRRIGFDPSRQYVTVRAGFTDTVTMLLRGRALCLVE